ncbi:hypothetical protein SUGI_0847330 [Cryptomeria japonica]|nr:hypothetical protein SUGI_0847120 [Cryptomeria japonica]GLJ40947.1 hypothetical protein SUGI_0847330 [Cryptomeria japonica]
MPKKLFCVALIIAIALAVGIMSGIVEAEVPIVCSVRTCGSDDECEIDGVYVGECCCGIGQCGEGVGYCCSYT